MPGLNTEVNTYNQGKQLNKHHINTRTGRIYTQFLLKNWH